MHGARSVHPDRATSTPTAPEATARFYDLVSVGRLKAVYGHGQSTSPTPLHGSIFPFSLHTIARVAILRDRLIRSPLGSLD